MYSPLNSYAYIHWILDFKYILYYVVNELHKRTNYLLLDCSFTESSTVSNLFNSNCYCMNLYSCQTWRFNNKKHLKGLCEVNAKNREFALPG